MQTYFVIELCKKKEEKHTLAETKKENKLPPKFYNI